MPRRAKGRGKRALRGAHAVIDRFGYLQLDTVAIAGARSHAIVLLSRLEGLEPTLGEELLRPGAPVFEYWGHEASWIPLRLYPAMAFRRDEFQHHPWWGDLIGEHPEVARDLMRRIRDEGPLRSADMEGAGSRGWWDLKVAKRVATGLWLAGKLAIRERRGFLRSYDLTERVIPGEVRGRSLSREEGIAALLLEALSGHGWATAGTLAATFRLKTGEHGVRRRLGELAERGEVVGCALESRSGRPAAGWIRPADLELAARLERVRPRRDRGVLLSPFDPVLWDRARVRRLFDFEQMLEIFKPAAKRVYGYYCLPVLAGERLVARVDLKADRARGHLRLLSLRFEGTGDERPASSTDAEAARTALERYAGSLGLRPVRGESEAPVTIAGSTVRAAGPAG
jgi:uncharacterized protein YcaQ